LRLLIGQTCVGVAHAVNSALVLLYWRVGRRIRTEILDHRRAAYGQEILSTLSKELAADFGDGFSVPNLSRMMRPMMRLAEVSPDEQIVAMLSRQLSWAPPPRRWPRRSWPPSVVSAWTGIRWAKRGDRPGPRRPCGG
jgi:hypothetical protein